MDEFCAEGNLSKEIKDKIKKALHYNSMKSFLTSEEKEEFFESVPINLKFILADTMF